MRATDQRCRLAETTQLDMCAQMLILSFVFHSSSVLGRCRLAAARPHVCALKLDLSFARDSSSVFGRCRLAETMQSSYCRSCSIHPVCLGGVVCWLYAHATIDFLAILHKFSLKDPHIYRHLRHAMHTTSL